MNLCKLEHHPKEVNREICIPTKGKTKTKQRHTHWVIVQSQLELVKIQPPECLVVVHIMIEISGCKTKRVELSARAQQQRRRCLHVSYAGVAPFPLAHDLDVVGVARKAVGITAEGCAKVDGHDDPEGPAGGRLGGDGRGWGAVDGDTLLNAQAVVEGCVGRLGAVVVGEG